MKKKRMIALFMSMILVLTTLFVDLPSGSLAGDPGRTESLTASVKINGVDIDKVEKVSDGDNIEISVSWRLPDGALSVPYTKTISLNTLKGVVVPDVDHQALSFAGINVGYASVTDGVVTLSLDNAKFLEQMDGRVASGLISGELSLVSGSYENGDKVEISLGEVGSFIKEFTDGSNEYELSSSKQAGSSYYNSSTGKWVQEYVVKIGIDGYKTDKNGNPISMTISSLNDVYGSKLSNMSSLEVVDNTISSLGKNTGDSITTSDLSGITIKTGEFITYKYTMEYDSEVLDSKYTGSEYAQTVNNTLYIDYKNNYKHDAIAKPSASIRPNRIKVSKVLNSGATDDLQSWTVTVDLGDLAKLGMKLADVLKADGIKDSGVGLEGTGALDASDFTEQPANSGIYKATYTTSLTDEYKNKVSTTVTNEVSVDTEYGKYTGRANYTTTGVPGASIDKTAVAGSYDSETGTIFWDVTLTGVAPDFKNVKVYDNTTSTYHYDKDTTGKTFGSHSFVADISVNGIKVISNGTLTADNFAMINSTQVNILSDKNTWGGMVDYSSVENIYFTDEFIAANNGAPIKLRYTTKVQDKKESYLKNKLFYNEASLSYTASGVEKNDEYSFDVYEVMVDNAMNKTGVVDNKNALIDYTIEVSLDDITGISSSKGNITITDNIPAGLKVLPESIVISDMVGGTDISRDTSTYYSSVVSSSLTAGRFWQYYQSDETIRNNSKLIGEYAISKNAVKNVSADKLTISIPVDTHYDIIDLYRNEYKHGSDYKLKITYKAQVEDIEAYTIAGVDKEFTNRATYEYDGKAPNEPAEVTNVIKAPSIVEKKGEYYDNVVLHGTNRNAVSYSVDINPNAYDLSAGKLTAEDRLGDALSYDLLTIKCYEVDGSGDRHELATGEGSDEYSYKYSYENNSLTFTLPDSKHLVIEYYALVNLYNGYNSNNSSTEYGSLTAANASNSFKLSGTAQSNSEDSYSISKTTAKTKWQAEAATGAINIIKYWSDGGSMVAVVGSKFKLYECDNTTLAVKNEFNGGKVYEVEEATGMLNITGLYFDTIYKLVEVGSGGEASNKLMSVNTAEYYFVIPGSITLSVPAGVKTFSSGSIMFYENDEDTVVNGDLSIEADKTLNGENNLAGYTFEFAVEKLPSDMSDTQLALNPTGTLLATQTNAADGHITFDAVDSVKLGSTWTDKQYGCYKVYEKTLTGQEYTDISFDSSYYIVKTEAGVNTGRTAVEFTKTITKYTKQSSNTYIATPVTDITFDNKSQEYSKAELTIELDKLLYDTTGNRLSTAANEFSFDIVQVDADGNLIPGGYSETGIKNDANGHVTFSKLAYDVSQLAQAPYYYKLSETANPAYINDSSYYIVKVELNKDNVNKKITASASVEHFKKNGMVYVKDNAFTGGMSDISFANIKPGAVFTPNVSKKLTGGMLSDYAGEFRFELTATELGASTVLKHEIVTNDNSGNVDFAELEYTIRDAGKTYVYEIKEIAGTDESIVYDDTRYYVLVTVEKDSENNISTSVVYRRGSVSGDILTPTVPSSAPEIIFVNEAVANGSVKLNAIKQLKDKDGQSLSHVPAFTFKLEQVDAAGNVISGGYSDAVKNDSTGKITFKDIEYGLEDIAAAPYYYKIYEQEGGNDYVYDSSYYIIRVELSKEGNSVKAEKTITGYSNGVAAAANELTFVNKLPSAKLSVQAVKTLVGGDIRAYAGEFSFELKGSKLNSSSYSYTDIAINDAAGNISFDDIEFGARDVGDYLFTLKEIAGNDDIVYDSTVYTIAVNVSQTSDNELVVTSEYLKNNVSMATGVIPEFKNMIKTDGVAVISGNKTLNNNKPGNNTFEFGLYNAVNDELISIAKSDSQGYFEFKLAYTTDDLTGTTANKLTKYNYYVKEIAPESKVPGMLYDSSVYDVTVSVYENTDGSIGSAVLYRNEGNEVNSISFNNIYNKVAWPLVALKKFENNDMTGGDFSFELIETDAAGTVLDGGYIETAENDETGNIIFSNLTFTEPATMYFVIREKTESKGTLVCDTNEYRLKVEAFYEGATLKCNTYVRSGAAWDDYKSSDLVFNNTLSVKLEKQAEGMLLPGAKLSVTGDKGYSLVYVSDNNAKELTGLKIGEVYTMKEIKAPSGYLLAEPISFYVGTDMKLYVYDSNGNASSIDGNTIVMEDKSVKLSVIKTAKDTGKALPGATMVLTADVALDAVQIANAGDVKNLQRDSYSITYVSGEKALELIGAPDGMYTLHESAAPEGYELAEDISFKVENGIAYIKGSYDLYLIANGNVIEMQDVTEETTTEETTTEETTTEETTTEETTTEETTTEETTTEETTTEETTTEETTTEETTTEEKTTTDTSSDKPVSTGDDVPIVLLFVIMLISGTGVVYTTRKREN